MSMARWNGSTETPARRRGLANRHLQFMALGGAIGAGLFLGSGGGIATAGPAILIAYALCGVMVFLIMRALGELAIADPARGSFSSYAEIYLGPFAGFMTGWSYWANWMLAGAAEITAVGIFAKFWFPDLPQWLPSLVALLAVYAINLRGVRLFGELEFIISLLKVMAILGIITLGLVILFTPGLAARHHAGIGNLLGSGGILPHGLIGLVAVLPAALFAYGGVEVIGLAAAETEQPERSLPRAINGVILRILVFYVGALAIVMTIMPWTRFSAGSSPFIDMLQHVGFGQAAAVVNLIVISAVLSSCNTGLFAMGRMLASLAERHHAPAWLARTGPAGLPVTAISVSAGALLVTVFLNWLIPDRIFGAIIATVALLLLSVWALIILSHWAYRRAHRGTRPARRFVMPLFPWSSTIVLMFIALTVALLAARKEMWPTFALVLLWYALLALAWHRMRRPNRG